ncbi:MAG: hypothetical protein KDB00_29775, partial [Planctomycetales bacterium]|nr:hypothetical protein [Planctomycetales bacterium]
TFDSFGPATNAGRLAAIAPKSGSNVFASIRSFATSLFCGGEDGTCGERFGIDGGALFLAADDFSGASGFAAWGIVTI